MSDKALNVDLTQFPAAVIARWFDPTNGTLKEIEGLPFANTGSRDFTPPAANSTGDHDWVLVLQAK